MTFLTGNEVNLKMLVRFISFSAHADFKEIREFIDMMMPPHVVLVHGDANEMHRLKNAVWIL